MTLWNQFVTKSKFKCMLTNIKIYFLRINIFFDMFDDDIFMVTNQIVPISVTDFIFRRMMINSCLDDEDAAYNTNLHHVIYNISTLFG